MMKFLFFIFFINSLSASGQALTDESIIQITSKRIAKTVDTSVIIRISDHHGNGWYDTVAITLSFDAYNNFLLVKRNFDDSRKYHHYYFKHFKIILEAWNDVNTGDTMTRPKPDISRINCHYYDERFVKAVLAYFGKLEPLSNSN